VFASCLSNTQGQQGRQDSGGLVLTTTPPLSLFVLRTSPLLNLTPWCREIQAAGHGEALNAQKAHCPPFRVVNGITVEFEGEDKWLLEERRLRDHLYDNDIFLAESMLQPYI
jgi:hypothetical protein